MTTTPSPQPQPTPARRPRFAWAALAALWPALLATVVGALLVGVAGRLARDEASARDEAMVREAMSTAHARLDAVSAATFGATATLHSLIRVQGGLGESVFRSAVAEMPQGQTQLRNVVVAPGDVIALLHPMEGNERVFGLDYRSVPAQWLQIERARQLRGPLIFAPVKLVQGGLGVVQRRPVFLSRPDGSEHYWGSISAVADLDRFVERAGLVDSAIELALYERRADGQAGALLWGSPALTQQRHLRSELQLPGAQWLLLGRPRGGWVWHWWQQPLLWGLILLGGSLVGVIAALSQRRRLLLQRSAELSSEIEIRRGSQHEAESAQQRLQALLATASDWYWEHDSELRLTYLTGSGQGAQVVDGIRRAMGRRRWEQDALVPGQPSEAVWDAHRAQLQRREPFRNFEYAVQHPGEPLRWLSISGDPFFDAEGSFCGYRGTGREITRLHGLSEELQRTHDHLQALLDSATEVAMIATDLDERIIDFSRGAERLLGYSPQQVIGSSPVRFHDSVEIAQRASELSLELGRPVAMRDVFRVELDERGEPRPQTWTYVRADGSRVPVSLSVSELHDRQGELRGYLGVAFDLSSQLATQEALRSTARRLQAVMDSAADVSIVTVDMRGYIELFNRGAERMLGCSADEARGRSARDFHLPAELDAAVARIGAELGREVHPNEVFVRQAAGLDGGNTRIWTYVRRTDGAHIKVSHTFAALRDAQGEITGYLAFARDVSQQIAAEQALIETRDSLQSVLDAALDIGVLVISLQGRIELFSKGAERLFGYRADEVLGQSSLRLHDAVELTERAARMSAELGRVVHRHEVFMLPLVEGGGASFGHWTYVRKDGQRVPGVVRLRRIEQAGGEVRFLAIAMDISAEVHAQQALEQLNHELEQRVEARTRELARTQEELRRSERLAALGSLVAGVAHDLNTPLGTCMTAASTLHDRTRELREALEAQNLKRSTLQSYVDNSSGMTELLLRGLRDAADLVAHFKQLSIDQTSENRRRFRLASVVEDVLTVMRPQLKQGRLSVLTDLQLDEAIDSYPGELGRLLSNLIQNAQLHAFEAGSAGTLRIDARPLESGWFELVVADDGRGMSEDVRRRAFDPFFTTKLGTGGSGLGLNIVHTIATALLGGSVELLSSPGQGARFVFRLPVAAPRREPTASRPGLL